MNPVLRILPQPKIPSQEPRSESEEQVHGKENTSPACNIYGTHSCQHSEHHVGNPRTQQKRGETVVGPSPLHLLLFFGPVLSRSIENDGKEILSKLSHLGVGSKKDFNWDPPSVLAGWWTMEATSQPKIPSAIEEEAGTIALHLNLICSEVFKVFPL